jgi:GntR family transcriptional repressor for pyruvate dehydrogenase complex
MVKENVAQPLTTDFGTEFEPILRMDLTEEIINRIKVMMGRGNLKRGSKLPPEREFARVLGVGRPALRQALKALSTLGIIESRVGQGTFINQSTSGVLTAPIDFMVLLNVVTIRELFEVRKAIEVELAGLAAERATKEDLSLIESVLESQRANLHDPEAFLNEDLRFHAALSTAVNNILFTSILESLSYLMFESRRKLLQSEKDVSNSYNDHEVLFKNICKRDKDGARAAMFKHLERVYRSWEATHEHKKKAGRKRSPEVLPRR